MLNDTQLVAFASSHFADMLSKDYLDHRTSATGKIGSLPFGVVPVAGMVASSGGNNASSDRSGTIFNYESGGRTIISQYAIGEGDKKAFSGQPLTLENISCGIWMPRLFWGWAEALSEEEGFNALKQTLKQLQNNEPFSAKELGILSRCKEANQGTARNPKKDLPSGFQLLSDLELQCLGEVASAVIRRGGIAAALFARLALEEQWETNEPICVVLDSTQCRNKIYFNAMWEQINLLANLRTNRSVDIDLIIPPIEGVSVSMIGAYVLSQQHLGELALRP